MEESMAFEKPKRNPRAFIRGAGGAGIGLIGVGVMFLVIGAAQRRKLDAEHTTREDNDRGPA